MEGINTTLFLALVQVIIAYPHWTITIVVGTGLCTKDGIISWWAVPTKYLGTID
jgi:hypothetical protein